MCSTPFYGGAHTTAAVAREVQIKVVNNAMESNTKRYK